MIDSIWAMAEVPAGLGAAYLGIKTIQHFQNNWYRRHPEAWPARLHDHDHDPDAV